jgi:tRNA (guanine37-N1)-methyltransferase
MRIDVISIFPPMFEAVSAYGVTGRALAKGVLSLTVWNPRDHTTDRHRSVDERPYGGGPGMVMRPEPLAKAIAAARAANPSAAVLYLSPQGRRLDQAGVEALAARPGLILLAGRYEGVDQRLLDAEVDEEWSIGDYVLSGGELPAMVLIDAVARFLPGVLGDPEAPHKDSFSEGVLEAPHYTRPRVFRGWAVPDVLLSGDHGAVEAWRREEGKRRTSLARPDLVKKH